MAGAGGDAGPYVVVLHKRQGKKGAKTVKKLCVLRKKVLDFLGTYVVY